MSLIIGCNESSPESVDTFIADFSVAVGAGQFHAGGLLANESYGKYARLMEIAKEDTYIPYVVGKTFRIP